VGDVDCQRWLAILIGGCGRWVKGLDATGGIRSGGVMM
jgi:hypothetical protein